MLTSGARILPLISLSEPDLPNGDPSRILTRQVLNAFFQYEKTLLVARLRGVRQICVPRKAVARDARPNGSHSGKEAVIDRRKELRKTGMAVDKIAEALNAGGPATSTRVRWHQASVYRILKAATARPNRFGFYTGRLFTRAVALFFAKIYSRCNLGGEC